MKYEIKRKILLYRFVGIFLLLVFFIFLIPSAFKARKNVKNIKNVKIGMDKKEVLRIMSKPDNKRMSFLNPKDSMYYYKPPFGASEGIYVQFDSSDVVNKIVDYE